MVAVSTFDCHQKLPWLNLKTYAKRALCSAFGTLSQTRTFFFWFVGIYLIVMARQPIA